MSAPRALALRASAVAALLLALAPTSAQTGPPKEAGPFREPDLVELVTLDPSLRLDVRYATDRNFLGKKVYPSGRVFLQRPAAEALVRVQKALAAQGYGLLLLDGYRPWAVTKLFWDATPADQKVFVANPAKGSRHNRGGSIDLTLVHLDTGKEADMGGGYDEFTPRSYVTYEGGPKEPRDRRDLLRGAMEREGFFVLPWEWWHFDWKDWRDYPILDIPFEAIGPKTPATPAPAPAR